MIFDVECPEIQWCQENHDLITCPDHRGYTVLIYDRQIIGLAAGNQNLRSLFGKHDIPYIYCVQVADNGHINVAFKLFGGYPITGEL